MREQYQALRFHAATLKMIGIANTIVEEYQAQGYVMTARQLYYQLVARDIIPNTLLSYKKLTRQLNDAKLAGLIDWDALEDRTRVFRRRQTWLNGKQILKAAANGFHTDPWLEQERRVYCIVEKEALAGVFDGPCNELDVPLLAARGYPSGSVLREFIVRDVLPTLRAGQEPVVLHFGDHDPSGMDMTRDLHDRFRVFTYGRGVTVLRCALNMDQIDELQPPENPAKQTDGRFDAYAAEFGDSSWELDALEPSYIGNLIRQRTKQFTNEDIWDAAINRDEATRKKLENVAKRFKA